MFKVVPTFLGREHIANVADFIDEAIKGSLCGDFKICFDF